ncbi:beta-xylosidase [Colletotrichum spaethianum]|uniref:Beta-xylosidase n=1 Tax=Colletotrichum spaethianum TaxID=700344 RepID=A0AA37P2N0_9PEZI|nr:beta-xylosidase [Colletotrichum spaethianum]GKT46763.1 beta-xylosidase [Colletotrichum spaethianum]
MPQVRNPILPGFNPDPSILRVGDDYYIATSTFEWFPGVQIHHSKDLANWELIIRPLNRKSQLDMRGDPDSCGVWAPCLTHDGEKFWLVYTDVKRKDGSFKDTHNYIVSAPSIEGPWSDSIYINSSGFDPSLFHDDDGRKWFVNMMWDHRRRFHAFTGIVLQEFDPKEGKLVGPKKNIFRGTELALVEGPHLYKRKGWYYLLTAEGGTAYEHACTLARSRDIQGPYQLHPQKYVITSKDAPFAALQRAGHGDIVDTPEGKTYMALVARRQTHFSYDAETIVDFSPTDEREFAGLTAYYCRYNFFYVTVTAHEDGKRELLIQSSEASWPDSDLTTPFPDPIPLPDSGKIKLALTIRGPKLQFYYALEGDELKAVGPVYDASIISDECGGHKAHGSFTGAFVGVAASDLNGTARKASFDYFIYRPVHDATDRYEI